MDLDPGWRPDPTKAYNERYWDGQGWTERVRNDDDETVSDFDTAKRLELHGEAPPVPVWRSRTVRLLVALAVLAGVATLVVGPVRDALDGVPATAVRGPADEVTLRATAGHIATAATDGRWSIVATYAPDEFSEVRPEIAAKLRGCFGDAVLGAGVPEDRAFRLDGEPTTTVRIDLDPSAEQFIDDLELVMQLRHDGTRWVLLDGFDFTVDDRPTATCTGRD